MPRGSARLCACGASGRGCPTPTTPTRPTISCRTRSRCSSTASTRTTSPTRRRSPTCCTTCSRSGTGAGRACAAPSRCTPSEVYTLARVAAAVLGTLAAVAALRDGRAPVRPRRRPARGGDRGGRVPAGLLRAPGAQRRAHARAADAVAARQRRRAAQRPHARLPAGRGRAGARLREQVHGRDRARAAARGGRRALPRRGAGRGAARRWRARARRGGGAGRVPDRQPLRGARLPELPLANWCTSRRCPPKPRASSAPPGRAASSTTCGR